jgi:hypothetical protein
MLHFRQFYYVWSNNMNEAPQGSPEPFAAREWLPVALSLIEQLFKE